MITTQILAEGGGVLSADFLPNEAPSFSQVPGGPSQLKVVHINDKEETKLVMNIARTPGRNLFETNLDKIIMATPLPVAPRIGVAIERKDQWANWVAKLFHDGGRRSAGRRTHVGVSPPSRL